MVNGREPVANRRRGHRLLQLDLAASSGVPVQVRWDRSVLSQSSPRRWAWHVLWSGGPTVVAMKAKAERAAADLPGVVVEDLVWGRTVPPAAVALALVRQVRLGREPLGDHGSLEDLGVWLRAENYPERGPVEDVELAGRLTVLGDGRPELMLGLLEEYGLAALTGEVTSGNVVPLRRTDR